MLLTINNHHGVNIVEAGLVSFIAHLAHDDLVIHISAVLALADGVGVVALDLATLLLSVLGTVDNIGTVSQNTIREENMLSAQTLTVAELVVHTDVVVRLHFTKWKKGRGREVMI